MKSQMTFCLGSDEHYFPGLLMAALTTIKSLAADRPYHFVFLDGGIEDSSFERLEEGVQRVAKERSHSLTFERVRLDMNTFADLPRMWHESVMTYARILLPELTEADSAVWVDSDMLIYRDLSTFEPKNKTTTIIAGVTDPEVKTLDGDCPLTPEQRESDDTTYVNCGLLWMNLKLMRETGFRAHIFEFMAKHKEKLRFWDQTAINATTIGRKETLPEHFNVFCLKITNQDLASAVGRSNLHMVSADKPWLPEKSRSQITRDLAFWKTWDLLTGETSTHRFSEIASRVSTWDYLVSMWKSRLYRVLRDERRKEKWGERHEDNRYLHTRLVQDCLDTALATWARG